MLAIAVATLLGTSAGAQETYHWPLTSAQSGAAQRTYFPIGTPIAFRTRTEVNTKQARPGDRFYVEVAESLTYRGQIVVPVGSPAVAEVIRSERNGHFGKKGKIEVRLLHVETPFGPVRLNGGTGVNGKGAGLWSIGGAVILAWPLALVHGTSGYVRHGTPVTGYLAEPLSFTLAPVPVANSVSVLPDRAFLPAGFATDATAANGPGFSRR